MIKVIWLLSFFVLLAIPSNAATLVGKDALYTTADPWSQWMQGWPYDYGVMLLYQNEQNYTDTVH